MSTKPISFFTNLNTSQMSIIRNSHDALLFYGNNDVENFKKIYDKNVRPHLDDPKLFYPLYATHSIRMKVYENELQLRDGINLYNSVLMTAKKYLPTQNSPSQIVKANIFKDLNDKHSSFDWTKERYESTGYIVRNGGLGSDNGSSFPNEISIPNEDKAKQAKQKLDAALRAGKEATPPQRFNPIHQFPMDIRTMEQHLQNKRFSDAVQLGLDTQNRINALLKDPTFDQRNTAIQQIFLPAVQQFLEMAQKNLHNSLSKSTTLSTSPTPDTQTTTTSTVSTKENKRKDPPIENPKTKKLKSTDNPLRIVDYDDSDQTDSEIEK